MDDTLDWRPILARLAAGWRVIVVIALAAGGLALAWRLADPARYQAEVILTVARPNTPLDLDPRFEAPEPNAAFPYRVASLRAYPELVLADGIAQAVLDKLREGPGNQADQANQQAGSVTPEDDQDRAALTFADIDDLRDHVESEAVAEGALIAIRARARTPGAAARLANTWAEVFIARMASVLGPELRVASPAVPSGRLRLGELLRGVLAAAALGALAGLILVLARGKRRAE